MPSTVDLARPLAQYAERFHAAVGDGHHVASPLGAWLVLALTASVPNPAASDLERVLGVPLDVARDTAAALLENPHPLVHAAAAVWHEPSAQTDQLASWLSSLPPDVDGGRLPTQEQADAWARRHTLGMIERFPLGITPDVVLLLASALATRISWNVPFEVVPADELGTSSPWSRSNGRAMRTPQHGHRAFIAATDRAGDVAVHITDASSANVGAGLSVTSVVAAPEVAASDVLAAAHSIAMADEGVERMRRSLFDLPIGAGHSWVLREEQADVTDYDQEQCSAVLPAWSASSRHDLSSMDLGFPAAARELQGLLAGGAHRIDAMQSAVARYTRRGFEAAALTAFAIAVSARVRRSGTRRLAYLRFGRPFAVVAVARQLSGSPAVPPGPWHGVPVFSAWVTDPEDARRSD